MSNLEVLCLPYLYCHDSLKHPPQAHLQPKGYLCSSLQCQTECMSRDATVYSRDVLQCTAEVQQCTFNRDTAAYWDVLLHHHNWFLLGSEKVLSRKFQPFQPWWERPISERSIWQTTPRFVARLPCKVDKQMGFLKHRHSKCLNHHNQRLCNFFLTRVNLVLQTYGVLSWVFCLIFTLFLCKNSSKWREKVNFEL